MGIAITLRQRVVIRRISSNETGLACATTNRPGAGSAFAATRIRQRCMTAHACLGVSHRVSISASTADQSVDRAIPRETGYSLSSLMVRDTTPSPRANARFLRSQKRGSLVNSFMLSTTSQPTNHRTVCRRRHTPCDVITCDVTM